jgi:hypothetical protein
MDNVSTYSRPLTPEQYNNIADEISKRLIAGEVIIDIGKIINKEFKSNIYHEADINALREVRVY